jgi:hypothetical protein
MNLQTHATLRQMNLEVALSLQPTTVFLRVTQMFVQCCRMTESSSMHQVHESAFHTVRNQKLQLLRNAIYVNELAVNIILNDKRIKLSQITDKLWG